MTMKKIFFTAFFAVMAAVMCMAQQTMWVTTGQVRYAFDTQQVDTMRVNAAGDTLTIQNKAFAVSDIDSIHIASGLMEYNSIYVDYAGEKASVTISGNIADRVEAIVDSAHVSVLQDSAKVTEEIFYTLAGESADGSFYQKGDFKATFILNGLSLTSSRGAAFHINDGKRVEIQVSDSTVNTFVDCANGKQDACVYIDGHTELKGAGSLVITGNTKHAIKSDEYLELKKSFLGNLIVKNAVGDGVNVNQYLEVKAGNIIVESCGGDGVQVDKKADTTKEFNGQLIMSGGTIRVLKTGEEGKGVKVEDLVTITDGTIEITSADNALHSKANMNISGGRIYAYSAAGNGVNSAATLTISGGTIVAYGVSTTGYGVRGATKLYVNGGTVAAMGAMTSTPQTAAANQPALVYKGVITKDTVFTLDDADGNNVMALAVTRAYSSSKQHTLLLTAPALTEGTTYALASGAALDTEKENWHELYTGGDAVAIPGTTTLGTATGTKPYATLK